MLTSSRRSFIVGAGAGALLAALPARAQSFPTRFISLVVPYAPGGPTDNTARRYAEGLAGSLGQSVVVVNKPGASTMIAAQFVARASKDGYTLLFAPSTTFSVNPHLYRNISYSVAEFAPISRVSRQTFTLTLSRAFPPKTVAEMVAFARANPGKVNYGTTGIGSLTHLIGMMLASRLGIELTPIHYRGTAQSLTDLLAGRLDMQVEGISSAIPQFRAGATNVVAVLSEQRAPALPTVPTLAEQGFPGVEAETVFGVYAPAGTPSVVVDQLAKATATVVDSESFIRPLAALGEIASASTPAAFAQSLRADSDRFGAVIRSLNLKLDAE